MQSLAKTPLEAMFELVEAARGSGRIDGANKGLFLQAIDDLLEYPVIFEELTGGRLGDIIELNGLWDIQVSH